LAPKDHFESPDGRLDLFVPGYVHYDFQHPPVLGTPMVAFPTSEFRGLKV
jgi:hypothetical protein